MKLKLASLAVIAAFATGAQAATIGSAAGVEADIVASGNFNNSGSEGALGLSYLGKEWIQWGTHSSWYWLTSPATGPVNSYGGANPLAASIIASGSAFVLNGAMGGLTFFQTITTPNANQLAVQVQITNNTGKDMDGVYWGVGFDPDGNQKRDPTDTYNAGSYDTVNKIVGLGNSSAVSAFASTIRQTVTLANTTTASAFEIAPYINVGDCCSPVDPVVALAAGQGVGFGTSADDSISLAYKIGTIHNNQTVTLGYSYTFAVPEPETYAMFLAGLGLMGAVVRRRTRA